jgi:hypothetical protein
MLPSFFKEILGEQGASVMMQLAKTSKELGAYLTPRIIVSWLRQSEYGAMPIPAGCPLTSLTKNGYGYSGTSNILGQDYSFKNSSEEHIAAVIAVASNQKIEPVEVKDVDLARLAKTIDLLCKIALKAPNDQHERTQTASNIQPEEPIQPVLKQPAQNQTKTPVKSRIPKIKKPLVNIQKPLKVTKSESESLCLVCGGKMFQKGIFVGCTCFKPMAKSVKTSVSGGGYLLTFDDEWDMDAHLALIGALKRG